jgi:hypothetical protein
MIRPLRHMRAGPPSLAQGSRTPNLHCDLVAGLVLFHPRNLLGVRLSARRIKKPSLKSGARLLRERLV